MRTVFSLLVTVAAGATAAGCGIGSVEVPEPKPDATTAGICRKLRLPDKVEGEQRRTVKPESPLTAAWGSPAIALRCGVPLPTHNMLAPTAMIDGVRWLPIPEDRPVTYTAVGRLAYVEVTIPRAYTDKGKPAGEILMAFTSAIRDAVPQKPDDEM